VALARLPLLSRLPPGAVGIPARFLGEPVVLAWRGSSIGTMTACSGSDSSLSHWPPSTASACVAFLLKLMCFRRDPLLVAPKSRLVAELLTSLATWGIAASTSRCLFGGLSPVPAVAPTVDEDNYMKPVAFSRESSRRWPWPPRRRAFTPGRGPYRTNAFPVLAPRTPA
jgi:hypothetical protein